MHPDALRVYEGICDDLPELGSDARVNDPQQQVDESHPDSEVEVAEIPEQEQPQNDHDDEQVRLLNLLHQNRDQAEFVCLF